MTVISTDPVIDCSYFELHANLLLIKQQNRYLSMIIFSVSLIVYTHKTKFSELCET